MAALEVFNQVLGPASGVLLVWILIKLTRLETRVEAIAKHEEQLRDHEKRLNLAEPKLKRAHERADEYQDRFQNLEKRGFSS